MISFAILRPVFALRSLAAAKNSKNMREPFELCIENGLLTATNSCSRRFTKNVVMAR